MTQTQPCTVSGYLRVLIKISQLGARDRVSRHLHPSFPCGVAPGDAAIKDHPKYPLQTVFSTDCTRQGRSPRQPAGEGSVDSFLVSAHFFLFSHFCCSHIAPARCHSRKETGKVKATHAQALPSPSRASLQQSQILAAAAAASPWPLPRPGSLSADAARWGWPLPSAPPRVPPGTRRP